MDRSPDGNIEPILEEYWDFEDVFSGEKANMLAPHPYHLQIELETGAKPTHRPIYSLSPPELSALQDFIEEKNTQNGFIRPSKSPWGSPVLFVKKKDGSLWLYMDFRALNKVTKKERQIPPPLDN